MAMDEFIFILFVQDNNKVPVIDFSLLFKFTFIGLDFDRFLYIALKRKYASERLPNENEMLRKKTICIFVCHDIFKLKKMVSRTSKSALMLK